VISRKAVSDSSTFNIDMASSIVPRFVRRAPLRSWSIANHTIEKGLLLIHGPGHLMPCGL
jgi:hypothetical protein